MTYIKSIFLGLAMVVSFSALAETYNFTAHIAVCNTVKGHDFISKFVVMVDNKPICETAPEKQTIPATITCSVPSGKQVVRIKFMCNINGHWEERSIVNGFNTASSPSLPAIEFSKDTTFYFLFDLESGKFHSSATPIPEAANVFTSNTPKPYKYAHNTISLEQLKQKEKVLKEYLIANADKVLEISGNYLRIGKNGTNVYHDVVIKYLEDDLKLSSDGTAVNFRCTDESRSNYHWKSSSSYSWYQDMYIRPKDPGKMDELYQKLKEYYEDVKAYYWRNNATKDNTPENVHIFQLQEKQDLLNRQVKFAYADTYEGIEYTRDTLIFHRANGASYIVHFDAVAAINHDSINNVVTISCENNGQYVYNTATKGYESSIRFVSGSIVKDRYFTQKFTIFYNCVAYYRNMIRMQQEPAKPESNTEVTDPEYYESEYDWMIGN
ncbi:MAG: hypothetical protein H6601_02265 [Flavobacteriales bacterium]|nr:hypothetical protein [Flavobacteriales bacterium]